jgi:Tfp pilus assembly protein PilF
VPTNDAELLQRVPSAADPHVLEVRALRRELDRDPTSVATADRLAQAYIDFGRQLGDAHYAGYAEAVLSPWLAKPLPPASVLVDYATILQYRHQFAAARAQLKRALDQQPGNGQAWLTLAAIDMLQGDFATATTDCSKVAATAGMQYGIACVGSLRSNAGQAAQSLVLLRQLDRDVPGTAPTYTAWIQGLLAEVCERMGDWAEAEAHWRKALSASPQDNYLLVAYADFLLDRNRPAEVLSLLRDFGQSDTAFLRLALAKAATHSSDVALYTWIMAARFEALAQRGDDYFGREQVRFALYLQHDPGNALDLAQRNWKVQRAPWDARVFLEAAQAAHQPQAALPVLEFLRQTRLEDPIIEPLAAALRSQLAPKPVDPR